MSSHDARVIVCSACQAYVVVPHLQYAPKMNFGGMSMEQPTAGVQIRPEGWSHDGQHLGLLPSVYRHPEREAVAQCAS